MSYRLVLDYLYFVPVLFISLKGQCQLSTLALWLWHPLDLRWWWWWWWYWTDNVGVQNLEMKGLRRPFHQQQTTVVILVPSQNILIDDSQWNNTLVLLHFHKLGIGKKHAHTVAYMAFHYPLGTNKYTSDLKWQYSVILGESMVFSGIYNFMRRQRKQAGFPWISTWVQISLWIPKARGTPRTIHAAELCFLLTQTLIGLKPSMLHWLYVCIIFSEVSANNVFHPANHGRSPGQDTHW